MKGEQDDTNRLLFWVYVETREDFDDWAGACIQAELRLGWAFKAALGRVFNIGPEFSYQPLARPLHSSS